jgi:CRISPR-associated protein Csd1
MLDALLEYAHTNELVTEPGFAPKTVRWALAFNPAGRFLETVEQGETERKGNRGRTFPTCPELTQPEMKRGGAGCRHYLVDSAEVVALLGDGEPDAKIRAKHAYFVRLLREVSPEPAVLRTLADSLEDEATLEEVRARLRESGARPVDLVTFFVQAEDPFFPVESDAWHAGWRAFRRTLARETPRGTTDAARAICLATGEVVEPAPTHPKIKGLVDVGGIAMGDSFASFKQEAFRSYGFEQAANAPVSEEAASTYRAALNHLLAHRSRRLGSTRVATWFDRSLAPEDDPFDIFFLDPKDQAIDAWKRARILLESLRTGKRASLGNFQWYALTLSGASGRVMVRDWMQGSFEGLAEAVDGWFADFSLARADRPEASRPATIPRVLGSLSAREGDEAPAPLVAGLWRSAVTRGSLPAAAAARALARVRSAILKNDWIDPTAVGLLKAWLRRPPLGDESMRPHLNEDHPAPAYQCGRLMAVLAAVQYKALGDVGAGVVQRYYAAASATPALVLGRLLRNAQFHLNKIDGGLAHWHEGRIAEVVGRLGDSVPPTLGPEGQSLFALGYYQQIAHDRFATRPKAETAETAGTPETPETPENPETASDSEETVHA